MFTSRSILFFKSYFEEFYRKQVPAVRKKIDFVLRLVAEVERVPVTFLKHVEGTEGLYEIRVMVGHSIFRIFCCFEDNNIVILFNGFQKEV